MIRPTRAWEPGQLGGGVAQASDLRVLLGALSGVGLGGVLLLTVLPAIVPLQGTRPDPATDSAPGGGPGAEAVPGSVPATQGSLAAVSIPRFDTVRVAPDGSGVVAGQAEPGATIDVLAGEEVAAEVTADAEGRFVAFLDLPPSAEPRALSLRDGRGGLSEETVIVAPTGGLAAGDVPVAGAEGTPGATVDPGSVAAGPQGAPLEAAAPATRDLPSDRPTPDLAQAEDAVLSLPRTDGTAAVNAPAQGAPAAGTPPLGEPGAEMASAETGASSGPPVAGGPEPAPDVATAGPVEAGAPSTDGTAPQAGPAADPASSSIALAVNGPVAAAPDILPEHGPAPSVTGAPGAMPAPEGGGPGQAAVLVSDSEGVRVLQPALAPGADAETLATVALDAIAYGDEGEVLLSGRASGGGAVRLYLDNGAVAEVPVGPDGQWSTTLTGTAPGDYTLRVDQLDAAGEVVSRIETPFRREARSDLAALMAEAQRPGQAIAMRTVQPGNTLWAIARERYGEPLMYVRVFEMNRDRIRNPDLIYPGQVFVLPATTGR